MIAIEGLSYRFRGSRHYALRDVTLAIMDGEFVVVTGPSGCGKSTLALAISGVLSRQYDGESMGRVSIAGMDALSGRQPIYDVAEVVGLVQQNPEAQFCTLTVQDEIAFGLENRCLPREEIWRRIDWALSIVGGQHLADRTLATLSGGEKQKVAIAAMMAARPQVLIFDEPTSNLDPTATAEVFRVIGQTLRHDQGDMTVIVIEHKVDYLLSFAPRLVVMDDGSIAYDGHAAEYRPRLWGGFGGQPLPAPPAPFIGSLVEPVVQVEDLHVSYNGRPVLRDLSLELWPGEFVAVMGDNGSGKTTFLQSLLGFLKPSSGRVVVCGQDTRSTAVSRLARQVGYVFQNPDHQLFADDVWQEATLAPRNFGLLTESQGKVKPNANLLARIEELLVRCGLGQRRQDHPYRLSYGQKRRLNLISVLAYAPRLILLDEVLIGQDAGNAAFLLGLLREQVEKGDTVVMINHAPEVTQAYASRLLFFDDGRVVIDAPTEAAFRRLAELDYSAYLPRAPVPAESAQTP